MLELTKYDSKHVYPIIPFVNNGAICWGNSLMQILLSCSQFNVTCEESNSTNKVLSVYKNLIERLQTAPDDPNNQYAPINMVRELTQQIYKQRTNVNFLIGQQCPDEAFHLLIDAMGHEFAGVFQTRYNSNPICGNCGKKGDLNRNQPNITLDLEFREPLGSPIKFAENIKNPIHSNTEYKCDHCHKTHPKTIIAYDMRMAKEVIIVRVKNNNVGGNFGLVRENVCYPEEFELEGVNGPLKYRLMAQVVHFGSQTMNNVQSGAIRTITFSSGGHYIAHVARKQLDGSLRWYTCNDSQITPIGATYPATTNAYLLMYVFIGNE